MSEHVDLCIQADKGMESLISLGEVGTGTTLAFDDYSLVSFLFLRQQAWTGPQQLG